MVAAQYNRMIYDLIGWRGAFPLIIPIQVGDYFELSDDGALVQLGNAFDWPGWTPDAVPVESEAIEGSETYYSGRARVIPRSASRALRCTTASSCARAGSATTGSRNSSTTTTPRTCSPTTRLTPR